MLILYLSTVYRLYFAKKLFLIFIISFNFFNNFLEYHYLKLKWFNFYTFLVIIYNLLNIIQLKLLKKEICIELTAFFFVQDSDVRISNSQKQIKWILSNYTSSSSTIGYWKTFHKTLSFLFFENCVKLIQIPAVIT